MSAPASRSIFSIFGRRASPPPPTEAGPSRRSPSPAAGPSRQRSSRSRSPARQRARLSPAAGGGGGRPFRIGGMRRLGEPRGLDAPAPPRVFSPSDEEGEGGGRRRGRRQSSDEYEPPHRDNANRDRSRNAGRRPRYDGLPNPARAVSPPRHRLNIDFNAGPPPPAANEPLLDSDDDEPPAAGLLPRIRDAVHRRAPLPDAGYRPARWGGAGGGGEDEATRRHREEIRAALAAGTVDAEALEAERIGREADRAEREERLREDAARRDREREAARARERERPRDMADLLQFGALGGGGNRHDRANLDNPFRRIMDRAIQIDDDDDDEVGAGPANPRAANPPLARAFGRHRMHVGGPQLGMPGMPGGGGGGRAGAGAAREIALRDLQFLQQLQRIDDAAFRNEGGLDFGGIGGLGALYRYGGGVVFGGRAGPTIEEQWKDIDFVPRTKSQLRIGFSFDFDKDAEQEIIGIDVDEHAEEQLDLKGTTNLVCAKCFSTLRVSQGQRSVEDRVVSLSCGHLIDQKCLDVLSVPPPEPPVGAEDLDDTQDEEFKEENDHFISREIQALGGDLFEDFFKQETAGSDGGKRATRSQTKNGIGRFGSVESSIASVAGGTRKRPAAGLRTRPAKKARVVKKVQKPFEWKCPVSTCEVVHISKNVGGVWKPKEGSVVPLFI